MFTGDGRTTHQSHSPGARYGQPAGIVAALTVTPNRGLTQAMSETTACAEHDLVLALADGRRIDSGRCANRASWPTGIWEPDKVAP